MSLVAGMVQPYFLAKASLPLPDYLLAKYSGNVGVSPAVAPQGAVGIALPVNVLDTGFDLKATISGRTPPEPPQLWLIGMSRERLHFIYRQAHCEFGRPKGRERLR